MIPISEIITDNRWKEIIFFKHASTLNLGKKNLFEEECAIKWE